jgi:hypothetical protein
LRIEQEQNQCWQDAKGSRNVKLRERLCFGFSRVAPPTVDFAEPVFSSLCGFEGGEKQASGGRSVFKRGSPSREQGSPNRHSQARRHQIGTGTALRVLPRTPSHWHPAGFPIFRPTPKMVYLALLLLVLFAAVACSPSILTRPKCVICDGQLHYRSGCS